MNQRKKWKIQRALGLELPDLGKPGALEKRDYPSGQHGKPSARRCSIPELRDCATNEWGKSGV